MYVQAYSDDGNPVVYVPGPLGESTEYSILTAARELLDTGEITEELLIEVEPGTIILLQDASGEMAEFQVSMDVPEDIRKAAQRQFPGIRVGV